MRLMLRRASHARPRRSRGRSFVSDVPIRGMVGLEHLSDWEYVLLMVFSLCYVWEEPGEQVV